MNPVLEQGANMDHTGSLTRPADVLIPVWSLGKAGAIDVTIAHPLNPLNIDGASATAGYCQEAAEQRKHLQKVAKCSELQWECLPLAVTPYGAWGKEGIKVLEKIAKRLAIQKKTVGRSGADRDINNFKCYFGKVHGTSHTGKNPQLTFPMI
jgi:hypothetical protein